MYIVQQIEVPGVDILSAQASYPCKQFPKNLLWSGWDLFFIDLAVGVYHPGEIHPDKYENVWKTVSLIVWIRRDIYSKDKVVILYGGFCVLQGIIELIKLGFLQVLWSKRDSIGPPWSLVMPSMITSPPSTWVTQIF